MPTSLALRSGLNFHTAAWLSAALLAISTPSTAEACSCVQVDAARAFEAADAVFEGRVIAVRSEASGDPGELGADMGSVVVELSVVRTWKGADSERVLLRTPRGSAACGYHFEEEESYLIYATQQGDPGELYTTLCSRTQRIEEAEEDLAELGAGVTPVDVEDDPAATELPRVRASQAGCQSCMAASGGQPLSPLAALSLAGLALALWLRRRTR